MLPWVAGSALVGQTLKSPRLDDTFLKSKKKHKHHKIVLQKVGSLPNWKRVNTLSTVITFDFSYTVYQKGHETHPFLNILVFYDFYVNICKYFRCLRVKNIACPLNGYFKVRERLNVKNELKNAVDGNTFI